MSKKLIINNNLLNSGITNINLNNTNDISSSLNNDGFKLNNQVFLIPLNVNNSNTSYFQNILYDTAAGALNLGGRWSSHDVLSLNSCVGGTGWRKVEINGINSVSFDDFNYFYGLTSKHYNISSINVNDINSSLSDQKLCSLNIFNYNWNYPSYCEFNSIDIKNTTILHYIPIEDNLNDYYIGQPVFNSNILYKKSKGISMNLTKITDNNDIIINNDITDNYICSCCINNNNNNFYGIVSKISKQMTNSDKNKFSNFTDTSIYNYYIDYNDNYYFSNIPLVAVSTHGDFLFKIPQNKNSNDYNIGDLIDYNGNIIDTSLNINTLSYNDYLNIIGIITNKMDDYLFIFKRN